MMRPHRWLRAGLPFFTAAETLIGAWAQLWPRSFYDNFPLPGHRWVANLPAYNEHVLRDFGGLNLALALLFAVAAVTLRTVLVRAVLGAYLVFAVPHLIFHLNHLHPFGTVDATAQAVALTAVAVLPVALLALTRQPAGRSRSPDATTARTVHRTGP
jgi:hypothetical protein